MILRNEVNFFSNSKIKISSTHWYCFLILHIVNNLDFGFIERRTPRWKLFIQIVTVSKCICGSFFYFTTLAVEYSDVFMMTWDIYVISHYIYLVVVLSISYKTSFHRLQLELFSIDEMNKNTHSYNIETKAIMTVAISHLYSIGTATLHCYIFSNVCRGSFIKSAWSILTMNAIYTVHLISFFGMYSVYCRLKVFVEKFSKGTHSSVLKSLNIYKAILDASDRVKKPFDCVYAAMLGFHMPILVYTVYLYLREASVYGFVYTDLHRLLHPIQGLSLLFAPAIAAGLIVSKADELKLILQNKLLTERNEPHSSSIQLFIDYIDARPMKFTVFGIVSLDWTLPVVIFNLCITYQIAIVQLTDLF